MDMTNITARATEQPVQAAREVRSKTPVSGAAPTAGEKEQKSVPLYDTYVPEDRSVKQSTGLYRLAHDEDGAPRIEFDRPEETTTNTDAVDQEIRELKEKQEQLKQQLNAAADPAEARKLEQQLAQTENELRQKDNDVYRRQNAKIS